MIKLLVLPLVMIAGLALAACDSAPSDPGATPPPADPAAPSS